MLPRFAVRVALRMAVSLLMTCVMGPLPTPGSPKSCLSLSAAAASSRVPMFLLPRAATLTLSVEGDGRAMARVANAKTRENSILEVGVIYVRERSE
jgi:hypothetical protein